jgi:tetraacyldisaccharide 4'-kinase
LLLARIAPTWIGKDRGKTYQVAAAHGADIVISDDGLQNPALANATLALLVASGQRGLGNGLLIPAGPLREPLAEAEARCHALIDIGGPQGKSASPLPTLNADFVQEKPDWLKGPRLVAFCGLGNPERFFFSLKDAGALLQAALAFPDHHPYSGADLAQLEKTAAEKNAQLVTTAKDAVKLPPVWRDKVKILDGHLIWRDPAALETLLDRPYPKPTSSS